MTSSRQSLVITLDVPINVAPPQSTSIKIHHVSSWRIPSLPPPRRSPLYRVPSPSLTSGGQSRLISSRTTQSSWMRRYASAYRTPRQRFSHAKWEISELARYRPIRSPQGCPLHFRRHNPTSYRPADCRETDGQSTCQSARCRRARSSST